MISGGAPIDSLMISGGVSRPIGHRTNIVSVKKWGGQSPPNPPVPTPMMRYTIKSPKQNILVLVYQTISKREYLYATKYWKFLLNF